MPNRFLARALAVALPLIASRLPAQTTALTHASVVDVETGTVRRDQTIILQRGVIKSIGGPALPLPAGARVADLRGGHVIPGLWDMHAHLGTTGRSSLALYVANGVTGVRDMGKPPRTRATVARQHRDVNHDWTPLVPRWPDHRAYALAQSSA